MFYYLRKSLLTPEFRGWRLEREEGQYYLSKFDEQFNDDEYRFYIKINGSHIEITGSEKIKNYKKSIKVRKNNPYFKKAYEVIAFLSNYIEHSLKQTS
ncbi:hypothetical protein [Tuberibacillus calidus]|uniref:hypothetical protein n=1 Tax=Tuberibacillus calidus TaxID=340097 RepID=UPI0004193F8A|nr:hypothetical protein [Tuberibacillus calidus]